MEVFAGFANSFGKTPCSSLVSECLQSTPKQPKLTAEEFTELAVVLMKENNI
jgi:hypothetical protein